MTHNPFSDFLRRWIALVIIALVCTQEASAQSALGNPFKRAAKEVQEVGILKAEHGPWMIFAYSFEGEKSKAEATSLAKEIQRDLGLPTFIMEKKFDYSTKVLGSGYREDGSQKVMKYRDSRVVSGYAVLAGEFESIIHRSLERWRRSRRISREAWNLRERKKVAGPTKSRSKTVFGVPKSG